MNDRQAYRFVGPLRTLCSRLVPVLFVALFWLLGVVGVAVAAEVSYFAPHGSGGAAGVAVDRGDGQVFIADGGAQNIVDSFEADGVFSLEFGWGVGDGAGELQSCGPAAVPVSVCEEGRRARTGELPGQFGGSVNGSVGPLAVDSDSSSPYYHDVYVYDVYGNRVEVFSPEGRFVAMFGREVERGPLHPGDVCSEQDVVEGDVCRDGVAGTEGGELTPLTHGAYGIGVQSDGTVWVADGDRVERFEADGVFQSELVLPAPAERFALVESTGEFYAGPAEGAIVKYSSSGVEEFAVKDDFSEHHLAIAADAAGDLFLSDERGASVRDAMLEFDASGEQVEQWWENGGYSQEALAVGESTHVLYLANVGHFGEFTGPEGVEGDDVMLGFPAPGPLLASGGESVKGSLSTVAGLEGVVNPEGEGTEYWFEYLSVAEFGDGGFANAGVARTGVGMLAGSFDSDAVSMQARDLSADTGYEYRLVARNAKGTVYGEDESFTTAPVAGFSLLAVAEPSESGASLHGYVDPYGLDTRAWFEYWPVGSAAVRTGVVTVAAGEEEALEGASLSGLTPGTVYRYRLVAENAAGSLSSAEASFTTAGGSCTNGGLRTGFSAMLVECRSYEQVTPVEKGGVPPQSELAVEASGDGVAYTSFAPEPQSAAGTLSDYVSRRTASGWRTVGITPPTLGPSTLGVTVDTPYVRAFSPDLESAVFQTAYPIDPEAQGFVPGDGQPQQVYLREPDGSFAWVSAPPELPDTSPYNSTFVGSSKDLSRLFFTTKKPMTAQAQGSEEENLYEYDEGQVRSVNLAPGSETLIPGGAALGGDAAASAVGGGFAAGGVGFQEAPSPPYPSAVSEDGETVFFNAGAQLYVRTAGETREVSLSERAGSSGQPAEGGAKFLVASGDGSRVLFYSETRLTETAPKGGGIYEYTLAGDRLQFIAATKEEKIETVGDPVAGASPDLSYVYLYGERGGNQKRELWLLHDGGLTGVGVVETGGGTNAVGPAGLVSVSPNGVFVALASSARLTAYDNEGLSEVYEYDAVSGVLVCVSCQPDGGRPNGFATINAEVETGFYRREDDHYGGFQVVTDSGAVFFDSTSSLVARDENDGVEDVYEYSGGEVSLVSSGTSPVRSTLFGVSENGENVFFFTSQSLVRQDTDGGLVDVYDARVDGGFPAVAEPEPCASSEECRGSSSSLASFVEPGSVLAQGLGDVLAPVSSAPPPPVVKKKTVVRCAKGKVRSKGRCVKRRAVAKHGKAKRVGAKRAGVRRRGRAGR